MEESTFKSYVKARGFMPRKPFIMINIALILFSVTAQFYFIQQSREMGIDVQEPQDLVVPVWGAVAVLLANAAIVPAIVMRARDAGWPPVLFAGLYGVHILLAVFYSLFEVNILTPTGGFVLQSLAVLAVIALMVKPSAPRNEGGNA